MDNVKSLTLSYTFFRTGEAEVLDIQTEIRKQEAAAMRARDADAAALGLPPLAGAGGTGVAGAGGGGSLSGAVPQPAAERIRAWTEEVAAKTGVKLPPSKAAAAPGASSATVD